ncbi:MAG: hypothetical protein JWR26_3184 [Pedosphaera sp.]|nr:hypothetical protein [Pedosphaera sp.]
MHTIYGRFTRLGNSTSLTIAARVCTGLALLLMKLTAQAQGTTPAFSYTDVGGRLSQGYSIALDGTGNRYFTGLSQPSTTQRYLLLQKYNSAGSPLVNASNEPYKIGNGIALDSAGYIYVAGCYYNPSFPAAAAMIVEKYDASLNPIWTNSTPAMQLDGGNGIAVGSDNHVYVAGTIHSQVTIGDFMVPNGSGAGIFLEKLDTNSTVLWATNAVASGATAGKGNSLALDAAGNSYITGTFGPGALFGGSTTLSNNSGSQDIFVAKYDTAGNLLWARSAGSTADDSGYGVAVDGAGNCYITGFLGGAASFTNGVTLPAGGLFLAKYDAGGNLLWAQRAEGSPLTSGHSIALDGMTNVYVTGTMSGVNYFGTNTVTGATDAVVAKYDSAGNAIWGVTTGNGTSSMFQVFGNGIAVDSTGRAFTVGSYLNRPAQDTTGVFTGKVAPSAPSIASQSPSQAVLATTNLQLSVAIIGAGPFAIQWQKNGTNLTDGGNISGSTTMNLGIANVAAGDAGTYSALVTNAVGSTASAPIVITVKNVLVLFNGQLITASQTNYSGSATIQLISAFSGGSVFYTLDGLTPNQGSIAYTGPFSISSSVTLRAIAYSSNLSQSGQSDPVAFTKSGFYSVTALTEGSGTISVSPTNSGPYAVNTVVTLTAQPAAGWGLLQWEGAAAGTNQTINVTLTNDVTVSARFGILLQPGIGGIGSVNLDPPGGIYAPGTLVQVTALPGAGYYASYLAPYAGSVNPLYITVTNTTQSPNVHFLTYAGGQASFVAMANGKGKVSVSSAANFFFIGQTVTVTATPDAGQTFTGWSGSASGTQNPINVLLSSNSIVVGNFTKQSPSLAARAQLNGITGVGYRFTLYGDPSTTYDIQCSSNLTSWITIDSVTNTTGRIEYLDNNAFGVPKRFYRAVAQ